MENEKEKEEKNERKQLTSSRDSLRRSVSLELPRVSSGELLWGKKYKEFDEQSSPKLRRILAENRKRRAPKDNYIGLEGREWRIEGLWCCFFEDSLFL